MTNDATGNTAANRRYRHWVHRHDGAEAFLTAIEEEHAPPATARDALCVTAVTEAAYEAARSDEWVDVALD